MISNSYFHSFAFPWGIKDTHDNVTDNGDGALFPFPLNVDKSDLTNIILEASLGWSRCRNGYARFACPIDFMPDFKLVTFGLKIDGISTAHGRIPTPTVKLPPIHIENYIRTFFVSAMDTNNNFNKFVRSNIHEVRSINSDIINAAYMVRDDIERNGFSEFRDLPIIKNIEALSETLKIRTDFLDVVANPFLSAVHSGKIFVYKKVDKIQRSLRPSANKKHCRINLSGASIGAIYGTKQFEVAPYLTIQNAIKYCPKNTDIDVEITENDHHIFVSISSLGPLLEKGEKDRVFQSGFRGVNAIRAQGGGDGIGLFVLKGLVENHHNGNIDFAQSGSSTSINDIPFTRTTIKMTFPRVQ